MIRTARTCQTTQTQMEVLTLRDSLCGTVLNSYSSAVVTLLRKFLESIPWCAARVDSLRSHGHAEAALRLAVSVVRAMKQQQLQAQRQWHESQQQKASTSSVTDQPKACTSRCQGACMSTSCATTNAAAPANQDGWVGHPLDPIGCLFDTLADASTIPDEQRPRTPSYLG